jgi:hypothetical protein
MKNIKFGKVSFLNYFKFYFLPLFVIKSISIFLILTLLLKTTYDPAYFTDGFQYLILLSILFIPFSDFPLITFLSIKNSTKNSTKIVWSSIIEGLIGSLAVFVITIAVLFLYMFIKMLFFPVSSGGSL